MLVGVGNDLVKYDSVLLRVFYHNMRKLTSYIQRKLENVITKLGDYIAIWGTNAHIGGKCLPNELIFYKYGALNNSSKMK